METGGTRSQAHDKARVRSLKDETTIHVVYDVSGWDIATEYDMDTYYNGARSRAVYTCGELEDWR